MPKVTVLMSVYNGQRYLKEAVESILCQTWKDFEFLIINDGCTDNSEEILRSFDDPRIRLVNNPTNIGLTRSLNLGLRLSRGEFIARQDADDISYPARLALEIQFLDAHPQVVLVGTSARAIDECGRPKNIDLNMPTGLLAIRWYLMFHNAFIHSSVMFRKSIIWEQLGGYDESFARAQDYELWSRIARTFEVENLSDVLVDHRFEYGSIVSLLGLRMPRKEYVLLNNLQVLLRDKKIPSEWARFIIRFQNKDQLNSQTDWKNVAEMYGRIYARYCQLYPDARLDQTIQSHLASVFYWISYYSAPSNRRVSLQAYTRARQLATKSKREPSLAKYLSLWITGQTIRRIYHYFRHDVDIARRNA